MTLELREATGNTSAYLTISAFLLRAVLSSVVGEICFGEFTLYIMMKLSQLGGVERSKVANQCVRLRLLRALTA